MRKLTGFVAFLSFLLFAGRASATTYYISFSSGSNSNNGTSQSTPWKSHPYMQTGAGCSGTGSAPNYSHSSGDQFVFKQGDSWPNACFDMAIQDGGTAGNPDVYTFDPAWGTPGGTTGNLGQPVGTYRFTAGGAVINGSDGVNRFIVVNANYVTLNGIEFTGMTWTGSGGNYGNEQGIYLAESTNVIVSNGYFHAWTHPGATSDALLWVAAYAGNPYGVGDQVTGNVFDGTNSGGNGVSDSGAATYAVPLADNNIVKNMSNGLLVGLNPIVHDNLIGPINVSFDSSDHENCIEPIVMFDGMNSTVLVYNNVWHDCYSIGILTQGAPPSSGTEKDYLWNNVVYAGTQTPSIVLMQFDSQSTTNSGSEVHAWNNTIYAGSSSYCLHTVDRGHGNFGVLDIQNNYCISDQGLISLQPSGNTYTNSGNMLTGTVAATVLGLLSSEVFPYLPVKAALGTGTNLTAMASGSTATLVLDTTVGGKRKPNSRPASGGWDVGAYQFTSSGTSVLPSPPTNVKVVGVQ